MRHLHLTREEVRRYRDDLTPAGTAWRAELLAGAQAIANAFADIVCVVPEGETDQQTELGGLVLSMGGHVLAILLPQVLEHEAQDLDGERDAGGPAAGGRH